jgi:plasmid stabilization system protein ParE
MTKRKDSFSLVKSASFIQQMRETARYYKTQGGTRLAKRFLAAVDDSVLFIRQSPYACSFYANDVHGYTHSFRKRNLPTFPYAIYFHIEQETKIILDVLYAHKMDVTSRFIDAVK